MHRKKSYFNAHFVIFLRSEKRNHIMKSYASYLGMVYNIIKKLLKKLLNRIQIIAQ